MSKIANFSINPTDASKTTTLIRGHLEMSDVGPVFKIIEGFEELLSLHNRQLFDINFYPNRVAYQLQHKAMDWFKEHNLFNILIENEQYSQRADSCYSSSGSNYKLG